MGNTIKLSHAATHAFWEIPVLFEDEHLMVLDKPFGMPVSPDATNPEQPSLLQLLTLPSLRGNPGPKNESWCTS